MPSIGGVRNHARGEHDGVVLTLREHLDGGAGVQLQIHAAQFDLAREVAQGFVEFVFAGTFLAMLNCPPILSEASIKVTRWPRSAAVVAKAKPAGPAPTTAMFFGVSVGLISKIVSWQARGLTKQDVTLPAKV